MEKAITDILKRKNHGMNFLKDRDETLSNYQPHSTTNSSYQRKFRYHSDDPDEYEEKKDRRQNPNKALQNRSLFRFNKSNEPLESTIFKKSSDSPFLQTTRLDIKRSSKPNSNNNSIAISTKRIPVRTEEDSTISRKENKSTEQQEIMQGSSQIRFFSRKNSQNHKALIAKMPSNKLSSQDIRQPNQIKIREKSPSKYIENERQKENPEHYTSQDKESKISQEYESQNLDGIDEQALFDMVSNQDWYKLLPEEVINNKNIDLEKFFVENSEYFYNLLCQNAQLKGSKPVFFNNDQLGFKLKYNPAFNSIYSKDFFKKSAKQTVTPYVNEKMMQTNFLGQSQIDCTSLNQQDYKDPGVKEVEKHGPIYNYQHKPFMGLTSYNSSFVNWQDYNKIASKAPKHVSTVEVPFLGRSSYQDAFCSSPHLKGDVAKIEKNSIFKGPIPTYPLFFGETNYSSNFKPYKVSNPIPDSTLLSSERFLKSEKKITTGFRDSKMSTNTFYSSIPSFEGQFKTTTQKDFGNVKDELFSAHRLKKIWRKKIIKKLEELRDLKEDKKINQYY